MGCRIRQDDTVSSKPKIFHRMAILPLIMPLLSAVGHSVGVTSLLIKFRVDDDDIRMNGNIKPINLKEEIPLKRGSPIPVHIKIAISDSFLLLADEYAIQRQDPRTGEWRFHLWANRVAQQHTSGRIRAGDFYRIKVYLKKRIRYRLVLLYRGRVVFYEMGTCFRFRLPSRYFDPTAELSQLPGPIPVCQEDCQIGSESAEDGTGSTGSAEGSVDSVCSWGTDTVYSYENDPTIILRRFHSDPLLYHSASEKNDEGVENNLQAHPGETIVATSEMNRSTSDSSDGYN